MRIMSVNMDLIKRLCRMAAEKGDKLPVCEIVKKDNESYTCTIKFLEHTIETKAATEDLCLYLCASNMFILCECPYELKSTGIKKMSVTFEDEKISEPAQEVENIFNSPMKLDPVSYLNGFARKTKKKLPEYRTGMITYEGFCVICCFMERITEGSSLKKKIAKKIAAFEMIKIIGLDASKVIDHSEIVNEV